MKRFWREENGLTLVEVVVATLLLAIGILGALTILTTGITVNDVNHNRTYALSLAEARMEYWKYANLADNRCPIPVPEDGYELDNQDYDLNYQPIGKDSQVPEGKKVTVTVTALPDENNGMVQIAVNVDYTQKKVKRNVRLAVVRMIEN